MADRAKVAWTEFRLRFILTAAVLLAAGVLVGIEDGTPRVVMAGLVMAVTLAALRFDAFIGIIMGLAAAAVMVMTKRLTGSWGPQELFVVAAQVTTLIELAWIVGLLGDHLRDAFDRLSRPVPGSLAPAHGSLGLLDAAPAVFRLDEELRRGGRNGQTLAVMLMSADVEAGRLDDDAVTGARRAVARQVETLLRDTDVPFALSPRVLGAILPETDPVEAWAALGTLVDLTGVATFADRKTGERHRVSDVVDLRACLVFADPHTSDGEALLEAALRELERQTDERASA